MLVAAGAAQLGLSVAAVPRLSAACMTVRCDDDDMEDGRSEKGASQLPDGRGGLTVVAGAAVMGALTVAVTTMVILSSATAECTDTSGSILWSCRPSSSVALLLPIGGWVVAHLVVLVTVPRLRRARDTVLPHTALLLVSVAILVSSGLTVVWVVWASWVLSAVVVLTVPMAGVVAFAVARYRWSAALVAILAAAVVSGGVVGLYDVLPLAPVLVPLLSAVTLTVTMSVYARWAAGRSVSVARR